MFGKQKYDMPEGFDPERWANLDDEGETDRG